LSTQGQQGGAILIEYNLASTSGSGLWDVHTRIGGFAGSELQVAQCAKAPGSSTIVQDCIAAVSSLYMHFSSSTLTETQFMSIHITKTASGAYLENNWFWVADHDIEDPSLSQITIYAGRGLLVESTAGGNWFYGTAVEHHQLYEYNLASTKDLVLVS
jgi:glucan 1,3-beta-glucosidase